MTSTVHAGLYTAIQQLYAEHMQLLDDGRIEEWAQRFTDDAIFATDAYPLPVRGRAKIIAGAQQHVDQLARAGVVRRHWLGMGAVVRHDDKLDVRSYALVIQSSKDDGVHIRSSTTCEDVLVPHGDSWLISERLVRRDTVS